MAGPSVKTAVERIVRRREGGRRYLKSAGFYSATTKSGVRDSCAAIGFLVRHSSQCP